MLKKANTEGNALPFRNGIAVLLSSFAFIGTSAGAHELPAKFEMSVVQDEAFGEEILEGKVGTAISGISEAGTKSADQFFAENNLCVALTLSSQFDEAAQACNAAVEAAPEAPFSNTHHTSADNRNRAIALSNRGVLRALTGDTARARADFTEARKLRAGIAAPSRNLRYLEVRDTVARGA